MSQRPHLIVIKTGALGDLLVSTPALWELHSCEEFESVSLLGSPLWKEILVPSMWPRLKDLWIWHSDEKKAERHLPQGEKWVGTGETLSQGPLFRRYQAVANLRYESLRFAWAPWAAHVKLRIGSCSGLTSFFYTHRAPWLGQAPMMHERERNFQVISAYPPTKNWPAKWKNKGIPLLKTLNNRTLQQWKLNEGEYVLVNPTASQRFKAWPAERYRELVLKLRSKGQIVRIVGTLNESDWLAEIDSDPASWVQPETIDELMDVVAGAKQLIANASSMHFLASSFNVPAFVLMGAAHPEVWAPVGAKSRYVKGKVPAGVSGQAQREQQAFASLAVDDIFVAVMRQQQEDFSRDHN